MKELGESGTGKNNKVEYVLQRLSKKKYFKAQPLLVSLLAGGDFDFNIENGEISYNGMVSKGSHIVDLVSLCVSPFPVKCWQIVGLDLFIKALVEKSIPLTLLSNQLKHIIDMKQERTTDFPWVTFEMEYV